MNQEIEGSVKKLSDASQRLREGIEESQNDLDKDGVIQRFEFTFELLWKALKIILEDQGIIVSTPKDCLKRAFKMGLIEDDEVFLNMLLDRNKTSHIYSRQESQAIFEKIKNDYVAAVEKMLVKMKEMRDE